MSKIAKYAFIAWLWMNKYGSLIKAKFYSLLMERLVKKGIFRNQGEVKKEIQALNLAVASADVAKASTHAYTLFGKSPTVLLRTLWDVASAGVMVYEIYDVVAALERDGVPDEHILVRGNEYLENVHDSGSTGTKSFEEMLAEFEAYADSHSVEAAVSKYADDPVLGDSIKANLPMVRGSSSTCNVDLQVLSREINIRKARVKELSTMLGFSQSTCLRFLDLLGEVKREDFFL